MPTMEDVKNNIHLSVFKGEPGTLKSTQALTYPKPQFWVSTDEKMNSMVLPMKLFGIKPSEITYEDFKDWSSVESRLEKFQIEFPYKTLVIDSVTSLVDKTLRQLKYSKTGKVRSSGAKAGKEIGGIEVNELEDFNAESSALSDLLAMCMDIKRYHQVNVIIIAHVIVSTEKTLNGETSFSRTIFTAGKKAAARFSTYADEVYHFNCSKPITASGRSNYEVITQHVGDDFARTGLPLPLKFDVTDKQLYRDYILPATKKLEEMSTLTVF